MNMIVHHGCQQIVGRADGVEISGEMQVDVLHGHHLGIAAAGGAALDAEHRPQGGLPERYHHIFSNLFQPVRQADGGGGFPLARRRGGNGGD